MQETVPENHLAATYDQLLGLPLESLLGVLNPWAVKHLLQLGQRTKNDNIKWMNPNRRRPPNPVKSKVATSSVRTSNIKKPSPAVNTAKNTQVI